MTEAILNWLWNISSRDACALIGVSFIAVAGVAWFVEIPGKLRGGLDNIADAIRKDKS